MQFFLPGVPQVYYVGALAGVNDMGLLKRTGNGRDINRHVFPVKEIDQALKRPVVHALNALCRLRNQLDAFDGDFSYELVDRGPLLLRWEGETSRIQLTFDPTKGTNPEDVISVAELDWESRTGRYHSSDLLQDPPIIV